MNIIGKQKNIEVKNETGDFTLEGIIVGSNEKDPEILKFKVNNDINRQVNININNHKPEKNLNINNNNKNNLNISDQDINKVDHNNQLISNNDDNNNQKSLLKLTNNTTQKSINSNKKIPNQVIKDPNANISEKGDKKHIQII